MNILIVNKYYFPHGGPEQYMFAITDLLRERGHRVIPLALQLRQNRPSGYSHLFLPPPFGVEANRYQDASIGGAQKVRLLLRALYYPLARKRIAQIVAEKQIDVVYLLNICNYISPSAIDGARDGGARVVMRLSDYHFVCASYRFLRDSEVCQACQRSPLSAIRYRCLHNSLGLSVARAVTIKAHQWSGVYQRVDAFVAPSRSMADALVQAGMPAERVHWLPGFADLNTCQPCDADNRGYVLYFGRIEEDKGIAVLLKAWRLMGDDAPPLWLAGAGNDEETMRGMAGALNLNSVRFLGHANRESLAGLLREASFVVAPSLWPDNSPNTVYEAMAAGKAVIGSAIGGIKDQILHGSSGLLVPANDPKALAAAVRTLWTQPSLAASLGKAARTRMETVFSAERHVTMLESIFTRQTEGYSDKPKP